MDFRESGVYMGEVKNDPVLDKIRSQKIQNAADAKLDSNLSQQVIPESEPEPIVMPTSARGQAIGEIEKKFYLSNDSTDVDELAASVPEATTIGGPAPTSPVKSSNRMSMVRNAASAASVLCSNSGNSGRASNDELLLSTVAEEGSPRTTHLDIEPLMRSKSSSCVQSGPKQDSVSDRSSNFSINKKIN